MLDFHKLEAFCCVYEQKSFSRAGEVLFLSQPTISAHVQSLEKEMNVKLLDRMGRVVLPTPAGSVLYKRCMVAFEELRTAQSEIAALSGNVAGNLVIGASTIPAAYILPDIISFFVKKFPMVSLKLIFADSKAISKAVLDCDVMLGVVGAVDAHDDLEFHHLLDDELVIVGSSRLDVPNDRNSLTSDEMFNLPWIMREDGSGTKRNFEEAFNSLGHSAAKLNSFLTVDSTESALQYAQAGLGLTVISSLAAADALKRNDLRVFNILGLKMKRKFYSVRNNRREVFPSVSKFLEALINFTAVKSK